MTPNQIPSAEELRDEILALESSYTLRDTNLHHPDGKMELMKFIQRILLLGRLEEAKHLHRIIQTTAFKNITQSHLELRWDNLQSQLSELRND